MKIKSSQHGKENILEKIFSVLKSEIDEDREIVKRIFSKESEENELEKIKKRILGK